jgi:hypothetical protein
MIISPQEVEDVIQFLKSQHVGPVMGGYSLPWGGPEARNRILDTAEVRQLVAESIRITSPDPEEYDEPAHYNNQRVDLSDPDLFSREATEKFFGAGNHEWTCRC